MTLTFPPHYSQTSISNTHFSRCAPADSSRGARCLMTFPITARSSILATTLILPPRCSVIFDALRVKIRDGGIVRNKAIYLALLLWPRLRANF